MGCKALLVLGVDNAAPVEPTEAGVQRRETHLVQEIFSNPSLTLWTLTISTGTMMAKESTVKTRKILMSSLMNRRNM
jgi:hypothetical protein